MKKISKEDFNYLVCCAKNYDLHTEYIESYAQQEQVEERNAAYAGDFNEIIVGLGLPGGNIFVFANCEADTEKKLEAWLNEVGVEVEKEAKRIWTEDEIKNLVQTNDKVLYGALRNLYN